MKKVFITFSLLALTFLISGCGCSKKNLKTVTCKMEKEFDEYRIDSTINIEYDEKKEEMLLFEEQSFLTSDIQEVREKFKNVNDDVYKSYGNYYESFIEDNKAYMNIKIDFNKITVDEFLKLDSINSDYISDGKIDYNKIILHYKEFTNYECS